MALFKDTERDPSRAWDGASSFFVSSWSEWDAVGIAKQVVSKDLLVGGAFAVARLGWENGGGETAPCLSRCFPVKRRFRALSCWLVSRNEKEEVREGSNGLEGNACSTPPHPPFRPLASLLLSPPSVLFLRFMLWGW